MSHVRLTIGRVIIIPGGTIFKTLYSGCWDTKDYSCASGMRAFVRALVFYNRLRNLALVLSEWLYASYFYYV